MPVSLIDLLPAAKRAQTVSIFGSEIECRSLTIAEIAELLVRVPELASLIRDRDVSGMVNGSGSAGLAKLSREAIGAIIAAGTGHAGDPEQAAAAADFPAEEQIMLLDTIIRLTAPAGLVPLVQKAAGLLTGESPESGKAPLSISPPA